MKHQFSVEGAGLGLRREVFDDMSTLANNGVDFMEVAPENWMQLGGAWSKKFHELTERAPFVTHGLSLSIGSPDPLDETFVNNVAKFIKAHNIRCYSEHLSYCSADGHMYDLLPIPFTEEAAKYTAERIMRVQDIIGQRMAVENVSAYAAPGKEMEEIDFINEVIRLADCELLLDVNNIYVNSVNHRFDAEDYLSRLPGDRVAYVHVAGHYNEADDLIVDTHGADVIDPVWALLDKAYELFGVLPTLLERDFNIPPMDVLMQEVNTIRTMQQRHDALSHARVVNA